jgi:hypothetical protein
MDWITLISGLGIGALGVKLLDILWFQKLVHRQSHENWLKDHRLEAFSEVIREFISFGLHNRKSQNPFESYASISRALLLIKDDQLIERIDQFIMNRDRLDSLVNAGKDVESEELYNELVKESREITKALRNLLLTA